MSLLDAKADIQDFQKVISPDSSLGPAYHLYELLMW